MATPKPWRRIAGRLGIEPRFTASKAAVLPLDDLPALHATIADSYGPDKTMRRHCFIPTARRSRNYALRIAKIRPFAELLLCAQCPIQSKLKRNGRKRGAVHFNE